MTPIGPDLPELPQNDHAARNRERRLKQRQQQQNQQQKIPQAAPDQNKIATIIAVGAVSFAVGSVGAFAYSQWQIGSQQDTIAQLALQIVTMQQDGASRNATPDLTAVSGILAGQGDIGATGGSVAATDLATTINANEQETSVVAAVSAATPATPTPANIAAPVKTQEEKIAEVTALANRNQMRMLTEGVVAGPYSETTEPADGAVARIALTSLNAPATAARIESTSADSVAKAEIEVPDRSVTDDGAIDTQTLILGVVQDPLAQVDPAEVAASQGLNRRAVTVSAAQTDPIDGHRYYVVEPGDSLAYLALQFFGDSKEYWRIYEANTDLLSNANSLIVGQKLRIPDI